jgi:hypothetical protein
MTHLIAVTVSFGMYGKWNKIILKITIDKSSIFVV